MKPLEERMRAALSAGADELPAALRDPHPEVISNALLNRNLTEEMAVLAAKNKATSSESLGFLASDVRFRDSYMVKLALCRNPKTPQRVTLSLLKFMRLFDLADIAKDQRINISIRQKIEHMLSERMPSMPVGVKTALARRAQGSILTALMSGGDERVVAVCLDSPALTEEHLYKMINRPAAKSAVIRMIAEHPKWSLAYFIRYALIRNFYTPMPRVDYFLRGMKTADLKDLYADPKLPTATKPFLFRELLERGETTGVAKDEVFDLAGDEDGYTPDDMG
jgi:hypothetical protein